MWKVDFFSWLEINTDLSTSSIKKYISAVQTISIWVQMEVPELTNVNKLQAFIDLTLNNDQFQKINLKGHNMYGAGLNYFREFVKSMGVESDISQYSTVADKLQLKPSFPIISNSFSWISEKVLVKEMDKSSFLHHGAHIPFVVLDFWNVDFQVGEHHNVTVFFHGSEYKMDLVKEVHGRTRLFWKSDFVEIIHSQFPEVHEAFKSEKNIEVYPEIRFQKIGTDKYTVDLIDEARNIETLSTDFNANQNAGYAEGRLHDYTGTRFERDRRNRELAIKYHGLTCFGCGFNFGDAYGFLGEGFIEIHHLNPLHQNDDEVIINPRNDLIPLCSNCHRMIHRSRSETLGLDALKSLVNENLRRR